MFWIDPFDLIPYFRKYLYVVLHCIVKAAEIVEGRINSSHVLKDALGVFVCVKLIRKRTWHRIILAVLALQITQCLMEIATLQ